MSSTPSYSPPPRPAAPLRRARIACKPCHARRVKCDVSESQPCWHCRTRQTPCELIESRRGKYVRKKTGHAATKTARRRTAAAQPIVQEQQSQPASATPYSDPAATTTTNLSRTHDDAIATTSQHGNVEGKEAVLEQQQQQPGEEEEGPEMLFARMAEPEPAKDSPGGLMQSKGRSYYLGESFSLAFIVKTVCSPSGSEADVKVHYPVPPSVADRAIHARGSDGYGEPLPFHDAFVTPPRDVSDELVRTFFDCIHPAYPVFDRRSFTSLYQQGQMSMLVLQTIYFLALTVCREELVSKAGFPDRATARRTHYLRAKALYDVDYEKDRNNLAAVLFLLGFWWAGPEDQKDTWHWLGCAISLAQTLGMHRSTAQSGMSQRHRSLWKRIWWSIYVRDRHAAAALGRPCRIRDEDCDIELLTPEDFQVDEGYDVRLICVQQDFHISYAIEMLKLAVILGRILTGEFSPRRNQITGYNPKALADELSRWESQLPRELHRAPVDESLGAPFWACMLHANYNNCQILLFRPKSVELVSRVEIERDTMSRMAADSTTRIAEDLLAAGTLTYGQLHLVPALFAALSIHAIVIRRKDPIRRQLAENRSRQCMLALSELAKCWPVGGWILRLFINLMRRLTGQGFGFENNTSSGGGSGANNPTSSSSQQPRDLSNAISTQHGLSSSSGSSLHDPQGKVPATLHPLDGCDLNPGHQQQQQQQQLRSGNSDGGQDFARTNNSRQIDLMQQADQLLSDALWAPNPDGGFDFDFLFQSASGGFLAGPGPGPCSFGMNADPDVTGF
ncbi:hypothetical protein VTN96DRAFT_5847 [Rasamsonia emersonii]